MGDYRKSSTAAGFSIMKNDPGQSTTNYYTMDDIGISYNGVGYLTVVNDPEHLQHPIISHMGTHPLSILDSYWPLNS